MKTKKELEQLVSQMTLKDKVGQLIQIEGNFFYGGTDTLTGPDINVRISSDNLKYIGSAININHAEKMIEVQKKHLEEDRNKIPLITMKDVIHGFKTMYPIPLAMGASFDPSLMKECCEMASREASAAGTHVTFSPMIDYVRDARWGRVMETCGEDQYLNSVMGAAQVEGYQGDDLSKSENIAACVKHFAGYGGAEAGMDYNTVEISERLLREYYLPAYKACIDAGVKMLMPSFNSLNGVPSVANKWLMNGVLRDEWGFDGVVISDYNAVEELVQHGVAKDYKDAAKMAIECGCHYGMMSISYYKHLEELVEQGEIEEKVIDALVLDVLNLKNELGLFDDPYRGASVEKEAATLLSEEHRAIARKAAEQSAVLLKNNGILPLTEKIEKIALIGPFATANTINGNWRCLGRDEDSISVYEGVKAILGEDRILVAQGCSAANGEDSRDGIDEAVQIAKEADAVILCIGEPQYYTGECKSRANINLMGAQSELTRAVIEANPNTAVVLFNGRPLAIPEIDSIAPAILEMWFPGSEGGNAAANLLFGRANPCGKVSMSFPKTVGQCPIYYNHPSTGRPNPVPNEIRRIFTCGYSDCGNLPLYSFGHGLSYSRFVYESMDIDTDVMTADSEITVKVTVKNESDIDGKEVVQLYMHDLVASTVRPIQSLIAFEKVDIAAGESKTVTFKITEPMLRFYDFDCNYISEAGDFDIFVGNADKPLITKRFALK